MLQAIESADKIGVSPVSCFELALAHQKEKLQLPIAIDEWFELALEGSGIKLVLFDSKIALHTVKLTDIHRDPFDRIIIATTLELNAKLASMDGRFKEYPELTNVLLV